jgi:serine/threonine protein kinase
LHRLEIERLVGRGYASRVFKASDTVTGTTVALKVYRKADLCPLNVHQIRREVLIHSRLNHPTVLPLFAAFEDANSIYMALEYCSKGDLYNYLRKKGHALSETQVSTHAICCDLHGPNSSRCGT